jgi:uroporphyrinogen decarboxylase
MDLCLQPELAAQVALGPVRDFDFDAAILFSDLLFPLGGLGLGLRYEDDGPKLEFFLSPETLGRLKPWPEALESLRFQGQALAATRQGLSQDKSLIGFVGGPFTLFAYACEGGHRGDLARAKQQLGLWDAFMDRLLPLLEGAIRLQLEAGAEVVMLFDTAAGALPAALFQSLAQPGLLRLARAFPGRVGYYSKGTLEACFSPQFLAAPWAGLGFDPRWDLRSCFGLAGRGFVQGNFDQALLLLEGQGFARQLEAWLAPLADLDPARRAGWVCGLGHGVLPRTPERNVRALVKTVRERCR